MRLVHLLPDDGGLLVAELQIISVDDHVVEPPDTWIKRLPKKHVDRGPRVVRLDSGYDAWAFEDRVDPIVMLSSSAGQKREDFSRDGTFGEMRPGCYDPVARLADMDEDGIVASLGFPSMPGFSGTVLSQAKDKELGLLSIQAYNDFIIDEWCAAAPGRYIPAVIVPLWDPAVAVKELERTAAKGARAVAFSENPYRQGFPSIHDKNGHWDPFFAAVQDANVVLCMHIGSSSYMPGYIEDNPWTVRFATVFLNACYAMIDWLLSGKFEQFPNLKVCFSEGGVGWMPYVIEHCDRTWLKHGAWTKSPVPRLPSSYVKDHIWGCYIDDQFGADNLHVIGIDNVMVEVDYPHTDSTWPNSHKVLAEQLAHLSEEDRYKVTRGNAEKLFSFKPSGIGQR